MSYNMSSNKAVTPPPSTINIVISGQDGSKLSFKIGRSIKIKKLLTLYCDHRSVDYDTVRFLIDDDRLPVNKTPEELGLVDGCEINAFLEMLGAGMRLSETMTSHGKV